VNTKQSESSLAEAINVKHKDVIAFAGAGGKTGLMIALASELFKNDTKVAITTTTKIGTTERPYNSELIVETNSEKMISKVNEVILLGKIPVLASSIDESNNRLHGISSNSVNAIAREVDYLLIEADGARRKPFKIPMSHEPVVPECVTKLCIVVGLDALGQQIDNVNFYNVEGMIKLGAVSGENLTIELIRKLMCHPEGYLRFKTQNREIYLLLNKIDLLPEPEDPNELAQVLYNNSIDKIIFTSTTTQPIVKHIATNKDRKIGGVILAAGESKRFNGIKHCADIGGRSLIHHITTQALNSNLDSITLVLGHEMEKIKRSMGGITESERLTIIENPDFQNGMSSSLKVGLNSLSQKMDALMFILGDQPNITSELLNKLIVAYRDSSARLCIPIVTTESGPRQGNPVIIGRNLFDELGKISGDIGAKELVNEYLSYANLVVVSENSQFQINTQNDLREYLESKKQ
jgi:molybdenum cofactor cytidylyltransferase